MDKLKLEPTAALVMRWSLNLYNEETTLRFVQQLDLTSGKTLYDKCHSICNWYSEIILNRKNFIKYLIEQELGATKQEYQLVFLAAGKSPLSIEILSKYSSTAHRIFEVDVSGMEEKQRLYLELFPEFLQKIQFIDADIASPDLWRLLDRPGTGFRHDLPTIVLLEGISYYLKKQELQNIISCFQQATGGKFIIEYLVPYHFVTQARRSIPEEIFNIIQEHCGQDNIVFHTKEELRSLFLAKGGDLIASYSMVDMELARTGTTTYFKKPSDGWIECIVGRFGAS